MNTIDIDRHHTAVDIALTVAELQRSGQQPHVPDVDELIARERDGYVFDFIAGAYLPTDEPTTDELIADERRELDSDAAWMGYFGWML
ncbi:MAG: hypothetical protein KDE53_06240 [Caldilineaceae bacterium]|nr:hypothetical protein [Caldilineaceae bacterium]